jgi:hypothetical protein
VTAGETRADVIDRYRRAGQHSDATIDALPLDATGSVPWWPRPQVMLFTVMVHRLTETNRHAGHVDILREQLDVLVGTGPETASNVSQDEDAWGAHPAAIEAAAREASAH